MLDCLSQKIWLRLHPRILNFLSCFSFADIYLELAILQFQILQEDIAQILQRYAESGDVSDMKSSYQQILDSGTHGTGFDLIWVFTIWNEQTCRIWEMKTYTIQWQVIDAKPSHWNSRQLHFYSVIEPVLKWRRPTHSFVPANFAQSQGSLSSFMLLNLWFLIWLCIDMCRYLWSFNDIFSYMRSIL